MLQLTGHSGQVTDLAFSPDGRWLASAGWDGSVRLWARPGFEQKRCIRTPYDHALTVVFAPDSSNIAIGFRNHDHSPDPRGFGTLAWTPTVPASRTRSDSIPLQDTWSAFEAATSRVAVHPGSKVLATCGASNEVRVWNCADRRIIWNKFLAYHWVVKDMAYSPDGAVLGAITSLNPNKGKCYVWDQVRRTPAVVKRINLDQCQALAFSPDSARLHVGLSSGKLMSWNLHDGEPPQSASVSAAGLVDIAFSPDGRTLLLAGEDGLIRLWDVKSHAVRSTFDWEIGTIRCVAFAPDGLTAAAGGDGVVMVWDVDD